MTATRTIPTYFYEEAANQLIARKEITRDSLIAIVYEIACHEAATAIWGDDGLIGEPRVEDLEQYHRWIGAAIDEYVPQLWADYTKDCFGLV